MKTDNKGFTLAELLIVIAVIGVLAAMFLLSSSETVTTAKASNIITNLHIMKRAAIAWHADNYKKVQKDGQVKMYSNQEKHPVQEWADKDLQFSKYLDNLGGKGINLNDVRKSVEGTARLNTDLGKGCYGLCDGGTEKDENNEETAYHRREWYVGYRFTEDEGAVREKIRGRLKASGLMFGTPDAHIDNLGDNEAAVWLRVF